MADHDLVPDDNDDGLLAHPDATAPDDDDAGEVQGSVPTPEGVGGEVGRIEVGGQEAPIDVPKAALDDPGPTPITPASSQQQYDARVKYEDQLNQQLAAWWEANKGAVLEAIARGEEPTLAESSTPTEDDTDAPPDFGADLVDGGQPASSKDDGGARADEEYGGGDPDGGIAPKG